MTKKQQLNQFFENVYLDSISFWYFTFNGKVHRILDYTLSEILSRSLDKETLKRYLLYYSKIV